MINLIVERSGLLGEIAHLPFLVGLLGALLIHRADPIERCRSVGTS